LGPMLDIVGEVVAGLETPGDPRPSRDALYRYLRRHRIVGPDLEQARLVVTAAEARMKEAEADV
ncbi:MAG: hypothetical protein M3357_05935, partial [Actinomycetota bacterium]|nr:hypothetical protein [Actinomycetota bacterium]